MQKSINLMVGERASYWRAAPVKLLLLTSFISMGRNSLPLEIHDNGGAGRDASHNNVSVRDRLRLKRNSSDSRDRSSRSGSDRSSLLRTRPPHHIPRSLNRKGFLLSLLKPRGGTCLLCSLVGFSVCAFVVSSLLLQNSITWQGKNAKGGGHVGSRIGLGSTLKYVPGRVARTLIEGEGLDPLRSEVRIGVRPPRLALVSFLNSWNG